VAKPSARQLGRLSEIGQIAARHGFGYLAQRRRPALRPWRLTPEEEAAGHSRRGEHLRDLLDDLGPTFVKFGQLLSTRPDVVPADIVAELRGLQDDVRPFPFADVEQTVRAELGLTIERAFRSFDPEPIAAASIGQVHRAMLPDGRAVAVKVQRPKAPRQIEADIELLYQAARFARQRVRALRFVDTVAIVDEFARSIRMELDYRIEARNAERFRRNFATTPGVHVPDVIWGYSSGHVLTLGFLEGVQVADLPPAVGAERRELAYRIADTWLTMIFRHGFFHADPHPANILLLEDGGIGLVDFGQAGKLSTSDLEKLTALFIDAARERLEALPGRLADLGVEFDRTRDAHFVEELRGIYDRYYGARLSEIDPLQMIREALALVYRMNLRLPTRFVLLDKTIATLGSVGVELYRDFNVFEVARPYARALLVERFRPRRLIARALRESRSLARLGAEAPYQVSDVLEELRDGRVEVGFRHRGLDELGHKLDLVSNRLVVAVVGAGGVIGSALIGVLAESGPRVIGLHVISVAGFSLSALLGSWLVWGVIRSGRL
jgi:ubiquinone biosynthesis protein